MSNPWLNIPLADYEGHMCSPEVQQLDALSELFGVALGRCLPASVAVLGIAGETDSTASILESPNAWSGWT